MNEYIVKYEDGSFCVYENDEFIADYQDLTDALEFALACADIGCRVIVESIE